MTEKPETTKNPAAFDKILDQILDQDVSTWPAMAQRYARGGIIPQPIGPAGSFDDELWVRTQLARFAYKPGWTFDVFGGFTSWHMGGGHVQVIFEADDTRRPGQRTKVAGTVSFNRLAVEHRDADLFARAFLEHLIDIERHEAREWFRRDGEIYDDPHKGEGG